MTGRKSLMINAFAPVLRTHALAAGSPIRKR
jgi:hypothetical protein